METEAEQLLMPLMLQKAAIEGNRDDLIQLLQLEEEEEQGIRHHSAVTVDLPDSTATHMEAANKHLQSVTHFEEEEGIHHHSEVLIYTPDHAPGHIEATKNIAKYNKSLQSVTHFGDTILHILVTKKHNKLAFMVFEKDGSLLKARNKMHETPLHSAAKVGNTEVMAKLIELAPSKVKDLFKTKNCQGNTAMHEAAKHGHEGAIGELMRFDRELAYEVNNKGLSPLYIAIVGGYNLTVKTILQNDARLAYIPDSNGFCPIHAAAHMGNTKLVMLFMLDYSDSAKLMDNQGRNLFHIAAEENKEDVFAEVFALLLNNTSISEIVAGMINATDYEGNTPFHIAAMKGHKLVMMQIWKKISGNEEVTQLPESLTYFTIDILKVVFLGINMYHREELVRNNKDLTPFDLSVIQVKDASKDIQYEITKYINTRGRNFTPWWFRQIMAPFQNKLERTQLIGLGSVLITTVAFAVAFTLPGGLNQDNGTPILGRRYIFKAFVIANTFAFIQAFTSLFTLVLSALADPDMTDMRFTMYTFLSAASHMVLAFGLGSYVMLAPISMPIAIIVLVLTLLFGSGTKILIIMGEKFSYRRLSGSIVGLRIFVFVLYFMPFIFIFGLPKL